MVERNMEEGGERQLSPIDTNSDNDLRSSALMSVRKILFDACPPSSFLPFSFLPFVSRIARGDLTKVNNYG